MPSLIPYGDGIPQLAHRLRPSSAKSVVIQEGLQAGRLAHGEITDRAVDAREHVLPTRNTVVARFQRLGGFVE